MVGCTSDAAPEFRDFRFSGFPWDRYLDCVYLCRCMDKDNDRHGAGDDDEEASDDEMKSVVYFGSALIILVLALIIATLVLIL